MLRPNISTSCSAARYAPVLKATCTFGPMRGSIMASKRTPTLPHAQLLPAWGNTPARHSRRAAAQRPRRTTHVPRIAMADSPTEVKEEGNIDLEDPSLEEPSTPFNWLKNWWPVLLVEHLDKSRPHAVTLIGRRYVACTENKGAWRVFDDACPHRLAPLSEGRIESDGTLQCSYHGWRFGGAGKCTTVPQAEDSRAAATACNSPRSAATAYPTQQPPLSSDVISHTGTPTGQLFVWPGAAFMSEAAVKSILVRAGMLFVWPDAASVSEAADTYIPVPEFLEKYSELNPMACFSRHLPYSYEMLLENLVDPGHLPFSHHGLGRLNRDSGGPTPMIDLRNGKGNVEEGSGGLADPAHFKGIKVDPMFPFPDDLDKATFEVIQLDFMSSATNLAFHAPAHVRYLRFPLKKLKVIQLDFMSSATNLAFHAPAHVRYLSPRSLPQTKKGFEQFKANMMKKLFPTWLGHLNFGHGIFDGDARQQPGTAADGMDYYLATSADGMVAKCCKWLRSVAGGGPSFPPGAPQAPLVAQMVAAAGTAACLLGCAVTSGALLLSNLQNAPPLGPDTATTLKIVTIAMGLAALAFAGLWEWCGNWVQKFIFVDYVHADKH
eukprot:gene5946-33522_t